MSVNISCFEYLTIGLQACNKTGTQYSIKFPPTYLIDVFAWWGRNSDTRFEQLDPPTVTEYRCDKLPCGFCINVQEKIVLSVSYSGISPRSCVNRRKYLDVANRYLTTEVRHDYSLYHFSPVLVSTPWPHVFIFSINLPPIACVSTDVCTFIYK